jgi:hypothetical protein
MLDLLAIVFNPLFRPEFLVADWKVLIQLFFTLLVNTKQEIDPVADVLSHVL